MKSLHKVAVAYLLACVVIVFSACIQQENVKTETQEQTQQTREWWPRVYIHWDSENPMGKVISREELMLFIKDNDAGVTEADFEDIDIDDFITSFMFGSPATMDDVRLYELDWYLKRYIRYRDGDAFDQMEPLVLISADSTDDEYERFIEAYFKELGMEHEKLNQTKEGFDRHMIKADVNNYIYLYTGKTEYIEEYDIRNEGQFVLHILEPEQFNTRSLPYFFYYSKDKKFFLAFGGYGYNDTTYKIVSLFTETATPLPQNE